MIDDAAIVKLMSEERGGLRSEIMDMQKSMHQVVFAFVTVAGLVAGLYWNQQIVPDKTARNFLLFALTQVDYFFGLFLISLASNQNVHAAYIRALEGEINRLCGRPVNLWETSLTKRYLFSPRGAFFWIIGAGLVFLFVVFGFLVVVAFPAINTFLGGALLVLELSSLAAFAIWTLFETHFVTKYAESMFAQNQP